MGRRGRRESRVDGGEEEKVLEGGVGMKEWEGGSTCPWEFALNEGRSIVVLQAKVKKLKEQGQK